MVQDITNAKNAMDAVRGDFNRVNHLYNELFEIDLKKEKLDNTNFLFKIFIHYFPLAIIDAILRSILLIFGNLGFRLWELIGLGMIGIIIYYTVRFDRSPYYRFRIKKINEQKEPVQNQIDEISLKIENYLDSNMDIQFIPDKYRFPDAVDYFYDVITVGRASNLKEAMNLYETYLHQWRLEERNKEMVELQQRTFQQAKSAKNASRMAAAFSLAAMLSKD